MGKHAVIACYKFLQRARRGVSCFLWVTHLQCYHVSIPRQGVRPAHLLSKGGRDDRATTPG